MFELDDYIVSLDDNGKKRLLKIVDVKGKKGIVIDKTAAHTSTAQYLSFDSDSVIAYLGKNPPSGNVYGVKIEPYHKRKSLDPYGTVYYFRSVNKEENKYLFKDLSRCAKRMEAKGLDFIFPLDVEIRNARGKTYGMASYKEDKDGNEVKIMSLFPHDFSESLTNTIYHEFGHFIWDTRVSDSFKSKWVQLYSSAYTVTGVDKQILQTVKDDFKDSGPRISEEYTEEYEKVSDEVLDYIYQYHGINYKNLCLLFDTGFDISKYFPTHVQLLDHQTLVTEYSNKSVEELFAESFMLYVTKNFLLTRAKKLMIKTLESVK